MYTLLSLPLKFRVPCGLIHEEVADYVVKNAEDGDLVLTLGCGDIYKAAHIMIDKLK